MRRFDVCNGDADGLCAVLQWRLHEPAPATLVTGLKREIALLDRVDADAGDELLVCDLSMQRNRSALLRALERGARVRYFDHHAVADAPTHPNLETHIDVSPDVCTSLLMDRHLGGAFRLWALVGAYGDNLVALADAQARRDGLDAPGRERLRALGEAINYNAYGETGEDVAIAPAALYRIMERYPDPRALVAREPIVQQLDVLRRSDLEQALAVAPRWQSERACVVVLPDAPWSRRGMGALANRLALDHPQRAHAVLRSRREGGFEVSVRAPLIAPNGADRLCSRFGGSGRARAAGIDRLPGDALGRFIDEFSTHPFNPDPRP